VALRAEVPAEAAHRADAPARISPESSSPDARAAADLKSPDPTTAAGDHPRRWQRRLVDQMLRDVEKHTAENQEAADPSITEDTVRDFTAGFVAGLEDQEGKL
jgi:hypothetical protein